MKNWKDKVLGIFAGIGLMALLMANNNVQSENGRYQISTTGDSGAYKYLIDTRTGEVWREKRDRWTEEILPLK